MLWICVQNSQRLNLVENLDNGEALPRQDEWEEQGTQLKAQSKGRECLVLLAIPMTRT